ncbi:YqhV family protein [Salirhabdus salicampi]|uniref:YqhV family protein n=1 Tax=Salirhabdus salicampi TaxID=476102 RepID=UPI0020C4FA1A|nr:YqhV family protein [Salirhabdus salicampi]
MDKAIFGIAMLRVLSGTFELIVAMIILKMSDMSKVLVLNSSLAIVGPLILLLTTTIGVYTIAEELTYSKMLWIIIGIGCILYGVKST